MSATRFESFSPLRTAAAALRIVRYYPRALSGDGGITNAVRRWSEGFAHAGAQVTIAFDEGTPGADSPGVTWTHVPHVSFGPMRLPVGLEQVLRNADLLVLHSGWAPHNVRAGEIARRLRVPYVLEPRGAYDPGIVARRRWLKLPFWHLFERSLVMQAKAIHVFFHEEQPSIRALGYRGPIIVVPNGVTTSRSARWDGGSGKYILWIGRYDIEHKGLDTLVRAVGLLPASVRPTLRLHGPDARNGGKAKLKALVRKLGLEPWIAVGDSIDGDAKFLAMAHAIGFVYPSRWEAFGNAAAEAMSVGAPTLTTPYPLGLHVAAQGGALVAEHNPQALADGLLRLMSAEAPRIAERGRQIVNEELNWDDVAGCWLAQIRNVL